MGSRSQAQKTTGAAHHLSLPSSPRMGDPAAGWGVPEAGFNQGDTRGEPNLGHWDAGPLGLGHGWGEHGMTEARNGGRVPVMKAGTPQPSM